MSPYEEYLRTGYYDSVKTFGGPEATLGYHRSGQFRGPADLRNRFAYALAVLRLLRETKLHRSAAPAFLLLECSLTYGRTTPNICAEP